VANGVLYYAGSNLLHALNPLTGASLWSSSLIGGIHWESPVVANGVLYITDESAHLTAYSLGGIVPGATNFFFLPVIQR
jgi:outer membrane protein assembly factor BamB